MTDQISDAHRILVVDDNPDIRGLVGLTLSKYRLSYACDGESGLEATRALRPDLVVLDVMMPKLDGFGFLDAISNDPGLRFTKVLVLSAKSLTEDLLTGYKLGALDYVTKPFRRDILSAKVDRLIQLKFGQEITAFQAQIWKFLDHHLRTPLDLIQLSSDIIGEASDGDEEVTESGTNIIREGVREIQTLIEQGTLLTNLMLDVPTRDSTDLGRVLRELWDEAVEHADALGGRDIRFDVPGEDDKAIVTAGRDHILRRAFKAVLDRAITNTRPGGTIEPGLREEEKTVVVSVTDDGPGISPDERDRLFAPFELDFDSALVSTSENVLGLPIAYLAARTCGGDLRCEYGDGKLTTFIFSAPIVEAAAPAIPIEPPIARPASAARS